MIVCFFLERICGLQQKIFLKCVSNELNTDRHAISVKSAGSGQSRQSGNINQGGINIPQIKLQGIVDLLSQSESRRRRHRGKDHIIILISLIERLLDERLGF